MSSAAVACDIDSLRAIVVELQGRIIQLESRVREFEDDKFEVIGLPAEPERESRSLVGPSGSSAIPVAPVGTSPAVSQASEREAVADDVGRFLRLCLQGEPRGSSGRDR